MTTQEDGFEMAGGRNEELPSALEETGGREGAQGAKVDPEGAAIAVTGVSREWLERDPKFKSSHDGDVSRFPVLSVPSRTLESRLMMAF